MPAKVTGSYSNFPASIREIMPYVEGEVSELRNHWQIFHFFFMDKPEKTEFLSERFGPLLGILQDLLEKQMILSISRLTDKDSKSQRNLSLWSLTAAIQSAKGKDFGKKVNSALVAISATVEKARKHRHKQIAHFDLDVSLGFHNRYFGSVYMVFFDIESRDVISIELETNPISTGGNFNTFWFGPIKDADDALIRHKPPQDTRPKPFDSNVHNGRRQ